MRNVFEFSVVGSKLWPRLLSPQQTMHQVKCESFSDSSTWATLSTFIRTTHEVETLPANPLYNSTGKNSSPHQTTKAFRVNIWNLHRRKNMISREKLFQLARIWQSAAAIGRKRISFRRTNSKRDSGDSNEAPSIKKGHFVVYTTDGGRFVITLSYLGNGVVRELLSIAEEEFGIPGEGPIVLPIDGSSMATAMSLIRQGSVSQQEKALLMSFTRCSQGSSLTADEALPCPQITCM